MWLSTTKLAKREKVTTQTIRRWINEGRFDKVENTRGGHNRVWVQDPDTEEKSTIMCWQPVETAPEHDVIDIWWRGQRYTDCCRIGDVWYLSEFCSENERMCDGDAPTHWMPVPNEPTDYVEPTA